MSTWRYAVEHDAVNNHTTITRGRMYSLSDTGCDTSDAWSRYWDGDSQCAFYDEGWRGYRPVTGTDEEMGNRAIAALKAAREYGADEDTVLKRVAVRLTGNNDAEFVCAGLGGALELYALSWGGDPTNDWRDEIESVWHGEVYRCEVEEYTLVSATPFSEDWKWETRDDVCEEWYGEDKADEALATMFPETEFPAELTVTSSD